MVLDVGRLFLNWAEIHLNVTLLFASGFAMCYQIRHAFSTLILETEPWAHIWVFLFCHLSKLGLLLPLSVFFS